MKLLQYDWKGKVIWWAYSEREEIMRNIWLYFYVIFWSSHLLILFPPFLSILLQKKTKDLKGRKIKNPKKIPWLSIFFWKFILSFVNNTRKNAVFYYFHYYMKWIDWIKEQEIIFQNEYASNEINAVNLL